MGPWIVRLLRVANPGLCQQRQCTAITLGGGFLRPVFDFLVIAGADLGIGKIILRVPIAGFRLLLMLAVRLGGGHCVAGKN